MLPVIPKPAITPSQKAAALAIAGCADFLQIILFPFFFEGAFSPFEDALDLIVATALIAICGFRWQFILAFFLETIPGLDLFPTWSALVLTLPTTAQEPRGFAVLPPKARRPVPAHPAITVTAVAVPPVQTPPMQSQS